MPSRLQIALGALACLWIGSGAALGRGDALPNFELPTIDGPALKTPTLRGNVVLVDFWASWCGPCRQSFTLLNRMHGELAGQGLAIVGINVDEARHDADAFLAKVPAQFTIALDPAGVQAMDFDVQTMPSSFLFGRDGKLRWRHQGYRPSDQAKFLEAVRAALAEAPP